MKTHRPLAQVTPVASPKGEGDGFCGPCRWADAVGVRWFLNVGCPAVNHASNLSVIVFGRLN